MNTTLSYTNATQLLEQGKDRDAYAAFLSVVESSTQQLHEVKFIHQTIVSKPHQYEDSIALLRSSLDQLEKIAILKLPGAMKANHTKSPPPPVPPKPSTIHQKPTIPPKPKKIITSNDSAAAGTGAIAANINHTTKNASTTTTTTKRSRGNSVSFADGPNLQQTAIIENDHLNVLPIEETDTNKNDETSMVIEEEDDDDDDDVVIDFGNAKPVMKRPSTVNGTFPPTRVVRGRSQSWVVQSDSTSKRNSIDVLMETVVDPSNLVPAQTNTGDSLALPNTSTSPAYVPNIPAPPLLATHRRLQQRLEDLQLDLEDCSKYADDGGLIRLERTHKVSCAKQTLEKVRTLYMSAMTIPSILQFPPHLVAYQLTLIESSIFMGIPRQALLSHSARTPHRKIVASTDFFNFMTRSIEHSILLPQEAPKRAEIILRWIKIATKLLALNNYQTLKAIVSALGTPPVQRLRRTWEYVPKKRMGRLELLNSLMSETDNYRRYREHMGLEKRRLWTKPVVPFLGVFIHDITYLQAAVKGNPDDPRLKDVLSSMQLFQNAPEYPQVPPLSYTNATTKKHLFRPSLHFGSSSTKNTNRTTTAALMGEDQRSDVEIELEQQLIMQYILMRPWVSEKTIDALSTLREPPKPRSSSSPTASSSVSYSSMVSPNGGGRPSSGFLISPSVSTSTNSALLNSNIVSNNQSTIPVAPITINTSPTMLANTNSSSSILGSASSFIRFNSNNGNNNSSSSTLDTDVTAHSNHIVPTTPDGETKRSLGGFWPFKKHSDINNRAPNHDAVVFIPQEQNWSEEDEDEDDEDDIVHSFKEGQLPIAEKHSTSDVGKLVGHKRSLSLPSKSMLIDVYK